jgi:hypothetical protein
MTKKAMKASSKSRLRKIYSSLYLDAHQALALRALHEKTRIPSQVLMRQGIDLMLKRHQIGADGDLATLAAFLEKAASGQPLSRTGAKAARDALKRLIDLP